MSQGSPHVSCVLQESILPVSRVQTWRRVQEYRRVCHALQDPTAVPLAARLVRYVLQPTTRLWSACRLATHVLLDRTRMVVGKLAVLRVQLGCIYPPVL